MPTITANNCQMFYEIDDFTDPWVKDKETVWLQHGVGRSTKFWYHWVPALARQYRVLRRDMRGHGQSADPGPAHRWSLDELVTDMRAFMDAMAQVNPADATAVNAAITAAVQANPHLALTLGPARGGAAFDANPAGDTKPTTLDQAIAARLAATG